MGDERRTTAQAEKSRTRRDQILDAAFSTFRPARLPRHRGRRHRGRGGHLQGRGLLPLPDQGGDLPRADADDRRPAGREGRPGRRRRDRADREGRGRPPLRARHLRRPPDDGPPPVPRRARARGAPSMPRRTSSTTASRGLIAGYLDEAVADGSIPPIDTAITGVAWFGALNEVVARWLLADDPGLLEDAYPTLRALLLRSVGVPEERIRAGAAGSARRRDGRRASWRRAPRRRTSRPRSTAARVAPAGGLRSATCRGRRPRPDRPLRGGSRAATWRPRSGCSRPRDGARGDRAGVGVEPDGAGAVRGRGRRLARAARHGRCRSARRRPGDGRHAGPGRSCSGASDSPAAGRRPTNEWATFGAGLAGAAGARVRAARRRRRPVTAVDGRRGGRSGERRSRRRWEQLAARARELAPAAGRAGRRARRSPPLAIVAEQPGSGGLGPASSACSRAPSAAADSTRSCSPGGSACARRWSWTRVNALRRLAAAGPGEHDLRVRPRRRHVPRRDARSGSPGPRAARSARRRSPARRRAARTPRRMPAWRPALLASDKDREEHAVVVAMLRDALGPIVERLRRGPGARRSWPCATCSTSSRRIEGTLRDETGILALAERLHPTPAVGGEPRERGARPDRRARGLRPRLVRGAGRLAGRRRRRRADGRPALRRWWRGQRADALRGLRHRRRLRSRPGMGGIADEAAPGRLGPRAAGGRRPMTDIVAAARLRRRAGPGRASRDAVVCPGLALDAARAGPAAHPAIARPRPARRAQRRLLRPGHGQGRRGGRWRS